METLWNRQCNLLRLLGVFMFLPTWHKNSMKIFHMAFHGVPIENFTFISPWKFHWYEIGTAIVHDRWQQ